MDAPAEEEAEAKAAFEAPWTALSKPVSQADPEEAKVAYEALATTLPMLMSEAAQCFLRPHAFFVAWHGALTLVFAGFPAALVQLKRNISGSRLPLADESFGSKWPKATLAAINDDADSMTLSELTVLRDICVSFSLKLQALPPVPVTHLSLVYYLRRSLETPEIQMDVTLPSAASDAATDPPEDEVQRVKQVLREWDDLPAYLTLVNKPGSRIGSYRESSPPGNTLAAFLDAGSESDVALSHLLDEFRQQVEAALPGRFAWLEASSLHCTVRGLAITDVQRLSRITEATPENSAL